MARSIIIKSIDRRANKVLVRIANPATGKTVNEVEIQASSLAEFREWIRQQFEDSDEKLLAIGLAAYIARDPTMSNPNAIVGKTVTLDLTGKVNYIDAVLRVS